MSKLKIAQLTKYCEEEAVNKKVYPVTLLQAVYDACTGVRLDRLLATINSIYLPYAGSFKATMLTVPAKQRRIGLIVTYKDLSGIISTVRYKDTNVTVADEQWGSLDNWEGWTFDNAVNDLAKALDVIFKDLSAYPDFSKVLHDTLTANVESYLDEPDNKTAMADLLKEDIKAVAKETTLDVWREACNYEDIVSILYGGTEKAVDAIFADLESHDKLIEIIRKQTQAAIADEVLTSVTAIFDDIHSHEDIYGHIVQVIDNKLHDIFYNVLDYQDLAQIVRDCINLKLADITADEEILAIINGYVKTWLEAMLTDGLTYPQVAEVLNKQICKHTNYVFEHVSKYPEILGAIDNGVYEKLKYIINNSEDNTAIRAIIDGFVEGYVLEIFKGIGCETPLNALIKNQVYESVKGIFNDLDNNPTLKLYIENILSETVTNIVNDVENNPKFKETLEKIAREQRHNIIAANAELTFKYEELTGIKNKVFTDVDITYGYPNPIKEDDAVIIEAAINDSRIGEKGNNKVILIGYVITVKENSPLEDVDIKTATIDFAVVSTIYTTIDDRVDNLITSVGVNADGSFKMFREPELDRCINYRDVTLSLLVTIRKVAKATVDVNKALEKYKIEADKKFIPKSMLGVNNGIPVLDQSGHIKKEFINPDYEQVFIGHYVDETKFINRQGVTYPAKDIAVYIDITNNRSYRWEEKYIPIDEPVLIGDGYNEAFEGYRGKQLERIAASLPKNVISDIHDAVRFADMMQIKYRGKTKTDLQTYTKDLERTVTLHPATEELAGLLLPEDKRTINRIEEVVLDIIKKNAEKVLELITPDGWQFVLVKKEDIHKEFIPAGYAAVMVEREHIDEIWKDEKEGFTPATYICPDAIYDDTNISEDGQVITVPDYHRAVIVKQTN